MTIVFSKDISTARVPASLTKLMTALVARQWVDDAHLDDVVTITSADSPAGPVAGGVANGDMVTYRDLFYLMLMTSRDDATHALARNAGALIVAGTGTGSTDPYTRFVEEMNTQAPLLGASSGHFDDAGGSDSDNRLSAADVSLLTRLLAEDAFLLTAAGTYSRPVTTQNGSPRTFACINLFDPTGAATVDVRVVTGYAFPEHVASKYGILGGVYSFTLVWETIETGRRVSVVMGCADDTALKLDLRKLINFEKARMG